MIDDLWVLKSSERDIIRETEAARLEPLTEDQLLALHKRVRRARTKHVTNYRRKAKRNVEKAGARGSAHETSDKARLKAEIFEEALAVVSERLAVVAHEAAVALRDERIARARSGKSTGPDSVVAGVAADAGAGAGVARSHTATTGAVKRNASSTAQGAARQAKRDSK
jgi:hypothetical protein